MHKKRQDKLEFRYYEMPQNQPLFALLGEKWSQNYGAGIEIQHFHNYMEIGFCYDGTGDLVLDGNRYRYDANMFSVIPKNYPHTTKSDNDTISRWEYLFIDVEHFLHEVYSDDPLFAEDIIKRINHQASCTNAYHAPEVSKIILAICEEMRNKKEFHVQAVRGLLQTLLFRIARMNKNNVDEVRNQMTSISQIAKALDYTSDNYDKVITVGQMARICHISETHFRRVFEHSMNMTPVEYINLVRVQMACEYMKRHHDSMEVVAVKCGFQTISTFNRNFKKIIGMTPYQWKIHAKNYEGKLLNYKISALKGW